MTPADPVVRLVLDRLQKQDDVLKEHGDLLDEIRANTNGRLRSVEIWQARADGAKAAFHWLPTLLASLLGAGLGTLVTVLASHA